MTRRRVVMPVVLVLAVLQACSTAPPGPVATLPATAPSPAALGPPPGADPCAGPDVQEVASTEELESALSTAAAGSTVRLRDGTYRGPFTITSAGTPQRPITLCGSRSAVLDGGPPDAGYALHLRGARHWRLLGFSVRGGQKGVMVDGSNGILVEGLLISQIGDEALHLRANSSDNVVRATTIRDTGLRRAEFGEGIYVGSAESNWCKYTACGPDRSDRNRIEDNDISATTAESVDVKEGTTGGIVTGNRFAGTGMRGADSWVDVKGNGWAVSANSGTGSPQDGFQVHSVVDGWGADNVFTDNVAEVDGPGYGFNVTGSGAGNVVTCSNSASGAAAGLSNIPCDRT